MDTPFTAQVLPVRLSEIILATPPAWGRVVYFVCIKRTWNRCLQTPAGQHCGSILLYSYGLIQELVIDHYARMCCVKMVNGLTRVRECSSMEIRFILRYRYLFQLSKRNHFFYEIFD